MPTLDDYNAWEADDQRNKVGRANIVLNSVDRKPDEVAGDIALATEYAKTTGNPSPPLSMVGEYRSLFQQKINERRNSTILISSPRLTEWLTDPVNASVAGDDLSGLGWFEGFGRGVVATGQRAYERGGLAGNQLMLEQTAGRAADRKRTFGEILEDARPKMQAEDGSTVTAAYDPISLVSATGRWLDARYADMIGTDDVAAAKHFAARMKESKDAIAAIPKSVIAQDFEKNAMVPDASAGEALANFATAAMDNPLGAFSWLLETAGESAPQMAAALGVTLATRSAKAGAGVMGAGTYLTERYTSPAEFFEAKKLDLSKPEDIQKLLADPALMKEAQQRGVIRGVVIGALNMFTFGVAGQQLATKPVVNMIEQMLVQAAGGSFGEYAARVGAGQKLDWNEIIAEGFAEFASAPVDVLVAGREYRDNARKAEDAVNRKAMFEQLSGNAAASAVRGRLPDKFREFVAAATADGPVENVFIPAEQLTTYFQGLGVDPFVLFDEMEGVTREDLEAALAAGGDVKIPTATYAARIAGSEHDAFLMENMRFDPNQFTAREAAEFNDRAQDLLDEAFEQAEQARVETEGLRSFEQEIRDTIISRLRAAGRSTDVAGAEAALYPAFYENYGARNGMTPDEFMARYVLPRIEGALPQGMQFRDVDELNRTLAEARTRKVVTDKRQSLLEFISDRGGIADQGGELKARDAEVIKRGKGKKSLKLRRNSITDGMSSIFGADTGKKYGADAVAAAAIEAGFMADDPIVNEYQEAMREGRQVPDITAALWAAIDAELQGQRQFSATDGVDPAIAEREAVLDGIEQYLDGLGVSLDDDDATIKAAVEKDQAGRKYGQGARRLLQSGGPGPRGSIQIPAGGVANGQAIIRLFENANLSTFVHETGHFFLTVMQDLAARGETAAAADLDVAKAWWRSNAADVAADANRVMPDAKVTAEDVIAALDNGTTGDVLKDGAIDVGMQEQWARGFEAYLMDGKAPSVELRSAFEKFRAWLLSIYKKLAGLGVKVSPELNGVFDRMLASDEQIATALFDTGGANPVFATAEEMGLSLEEYARFLALRDQSEAEAKARLLGEVMAPLKRERDKEYKAEKAKVRDEVEAEVNAYRYYRAFEWMANKRWLSEGQPATLPDMRLSKEALVARYGAGVLKTLPRGKQSLFVAGGMDPDEAAGWFGFDSGDAMIRAIEKAPGRKEAISAETDRIMRDRHGDPLTDGSLEAAALDAVHGDKRGEWIAAELKAVADVAGVKVTLTAKEAKATAKAILSREKVRDAVNFNRFLAAERKAGREAARLGAMLAREKIWTDNARRKIAGKARAALREEGSAEAVAPQIERANRSTDSYNETVAKFIEAKRRQLHNHALYNEARSVAGEVEKAENYVARLNKKSKREQIGGAGRREGATVDYLAAIDEVLDQYDFRRLSATAEQRRGALNAFIAAMTAAGREGELSIPDSVLEDAGRKPYKTIPVEELRGVIDTLKNLEHVAVRWDKLIDEKQERDLQATVDGVVEAFDKNVKKRPPGRVKSTGETLRNAGRQFLDIVLNAGTILREIDGFKDLGAAYKALKSPIDDAMNRLIVRKEAAVAAFEKIYSVYTKAERRQMAVSEHIDALGYSLSKWARLAVALNMGNEGNRQRLTDPKVGGSMTTDQVQAVLATLDERDANFVQSVWDFIGTYQPDMAARERRKTGVEPKWVEPSPVTIAGQVLRGGYYPIKSDTRLSNAARDNEMNDLASSLMAGRFGKAQTRNGHLKDRAKASGQALELDIAVVHRHVNQVIYDLELSEAVSNSWRVLKDSRVRNAFREAGKQADFDALELWLKDVAEGEMRSAEPVGRTARIVKSNFTFAKLAFNLSTVALQITGLTQSIVVVGKKDMAIGISKTLANPVQLASDIAAKSAYMRTRETTFNKDIYDFYNDPQMGPVASRWGDFKRERLGPLAFYLMTKVQWHIVDVPTWYAGYNQGLRKYANDEAQAIAHADAIVKRSQASGLFSDRSAVERGTVSRNARQNDVIRLFTALGSYMFAKFNVAYERTQIAGQVMSKEGVSLRSAQEALSLTVDMAFLFTVEAVIMAMIKGGLPDDDDEKNDSWLKFLAKQTGLSIMGTIPFVRDGASALQGYSGGGAYGSAIEDTARGIYSAGKVIVRPFTDTELKISDLKAIINTTAIAVGLPGVQINRLVDAADRQYEGEDVSPLEYLLGKFKK